MSRPQMTRKLVLETPGRVPDGAGGYTQTWTALGIVWAEVLPRTGREDSAASRLGLKITLRAAPQGAPSRPTPQQRFRDGARLYLIEAVTEADPTGRFLTCFAIEETGA